MITLLAYPIAIAFFVSAPIIPVVSEKEPNRKPGYDFVDETGQPMNVMVIAGKTLDAAAYPKNLQLQFVAKGETYLPSTEDIEAFENSFFVFAKGYAIDLLAVDAQVSRNYEIPMKPEDAIRVQVFDETGVPAVGVRVWPAQMDFDESAWYANVPFSVPDWITAHTDQEGFATLHGAKRDRLLGVYVAKDKQRGVQYAIPRQWDHESTLSLHVKKATGSLRCEVRDESGAPVVGARLYADTHEEWINPEVIRAPEAIFSEFLGETNAMGHLLIPEIPECTINVRLFSHSRSVGYGEYRKEIKVMPGQETKVLFVRKPLQQVSVSLVDLSDEVSLANVPIRFLYRETGESCSVVAETDDDGIATLWLQPGRWQYKIEDSGLPIDYCPFPSAAPSTYLVVESNDLQVAKPLLVDKGRIIEGRIADFDPRKLRNHWIQMETGESRWMSSLSVDGGFRFVVPKSLTDEDVVGFHMATRVLKPPSELKLETKKPWLLRLVPK